MVSSFKKESVATKPKRKKASKKSKGLINAASRKFCPLFYPLLLHFICCSILRCHDAVAKATKVKLSLWLMMLARIQMDFHFTLIVFFFLSGKSVEFYYCRRGISYFRACPFACQRPIEWRKMSTRQHVRHTLSSASQGSSLSLWLLELER